MRTLNKSRNLLAYALLTAMAFTCIIMLSGPVPAIAEGSSGSGPFPIDTIPANGGGDTTGGANSFESGINMPSTLDLILLVMDMTIY